MNAVKVSVVVPVYNVESYLRECLDSICAQTLEDIEIICVNDGSTDSSPSILRTYAEADKRIRIIDQENGGLSAARNSGMAAAVGEYLYFCDSDDYILKDTLAVLYREAKEKELDILLFSGESFFERPELEKKLGRYRDYYKCEALSCRSGAELFDELWRIDRFRPSIPLQFYRRQFLIEAQLSFMKGLISEDELFTPFALLKAQRAASTADVFYMRRFRADSIMTSAPKHQKFDSLFTIFAKLSAEYIHGDYQTKAGGYGLHASAEAVHYSSIMTYKALPPEEQALVLKNVSPGIALLFEGSRHFMNSYTYRAGRIVTWLPQRLKKIIKG